MAVIRNPNNELYYAGVGTPDNNNGILILVKNKNGYSGFLTVDNDGITYDVVYLNDIVVHKVISW